MAGINLLHVPYQGASPAPTDLLGGRADVMFEAMPTLVSLRRVFGAGATGGVRWHGFLRQKLITGNLGNICCTRASGAVTKRTISAAPASLKSRCFRP
jgi:hypothetical protein